MSVFIERSQMEISPVKNSRKWLEMSADLFRNIKHMMLTLYAMFGADVNLGFICGLWEPANIISSLLCCEIN